VVKICCSSLLFKHDILTKHYKSICPQFKPFVNVFTVLSITVYILVDDYMEYFKVY